VRNFGLYRLGTVGKFARVFNMVLRLTTPTTTKTPTTTETKTKTTTAKAKTKQKQEILGSSPSCMHEC